MGLFKTKKPHLIVTPTHVWNAIKTKYIIQMWLKLGVGVGGGAGGSALCAKFLVHILCWCKSFVSRQAVKTGLVQ